MKIRNGVLVSINKSKDIKRGMFVIPNGVTSIGNGVFFCCSGLTSITIPDSVTSIGDSAFAYCIGLTNITIPDSVTSIGIQAFLCCIGLTSVTIGNGVTLIKNSTFRGCTNLSNITIPKNVKSIRGFAFANCHKLTKTDDKYYYKAFTSDLSCRYFKFEENKWFECEGEPIMCENGFHACKNAFDLFNYYNGELNENIIIYKVELEGISDEREDDSKVVAKRIRLVEKINSYSELLNKVQ